jgi:hypothetical protein
VDVLALSVAHLAVKKQLHGPSVEMVAFSENQHGARNIGSNYMIAQGDVIATFVEPEA